jgi:hypothetical protein
VEIPATLAILVNFGKSLSVFDDSSKMPLDASCRNQPPMMVQGQIHHLQQSSLKKEGFSRERFVRNQKTR